MPIFLHMTLKTNLLLLVCFVFVVTITWHDTAIRRAGVKWQVAECHIWKTCQSDSYVVVYVAKTQYTCEIAQEAQLQWSIICKWVLLINKGGRVFVLNLSSRAKHGENSVIKEAEVSIQVKNSDHITCSDSDGLHLLFLDLNQWLSRHYCLFVTDKAE